ncbi:hypothetical protein SAMN05428948_4843 [Massilia sp. CF038]|nr:hypothetical protein SAMN05428948_4843 [Massilia sp. CF038]
MLGGGLPFMLALSLAAGMLTAKTAPGTGGADVLGLLVLCSGTYLFACLLIIPALLSIPYLISRDRLRLSTRLTAAIFLALTLLALPLIYLFVSPG